MIAVTRRLLERLRVYRASADPLTATGNFVALVLAFNQPFYPIYLFALLGPRGWPGLASGALGFAIYLAVPSLGRRAPLRGRIALCLGAVCHIVATDWMLGAESGIALFLAPCALLAALLFRPRERRYMLPLVALSLLAFIATLGRFGTGWAGYAPEESRALFALNTASMTALVAFLGVVFANLRPAPETLR